MVRSSDGRHVRARRNGFCHLTIEDDELTAQVTVDHAHARRLADALESRTPCQMSTTEGRVLHFTGTQLGDPDQSAISYRALNGRQRTTGMWEFGEQECARLAAEIREAVNG